MPPDASKGFLAIYGSSPPQIDAHINSLSTVRELDEFAALQTQEEARLFNERTKQCELQGIPPPKPPVLLLPAKALSTVMREAAEELKIKYRITDSTYAALDSFEAYKKRRDARP
jgi:hypothetical protein